ncbi:hypothetical protein Salat_1880700 [Sesamum alatum]|uniref:Uncharacterized protein n=1 Tax=Sesamum alatum TaxID=300844 RepID=A0AAE1Y3A2_9LAMI|nr:hypothetical protein Salat_1880700 [Sesamum alatum]
MCQPKVVGPSYFLASLPLLRGPRAFDLRCLYSRALVLSSLVTSSQGPSYFLASSSLLRGPRAFELRCLFSRALVFSSLVASSQGPSFLRALLPLLMSPRALVPSSFAASSHEPAYFLASSPLLRGPRSFELCCLFSGALVPSSLVASSQGPSCLRASLPLLMKAVRKLAADIALPGEYDWVVPSPNQFANNPPPGYLTVYSAQLTSGLRFPLPDLLVQFFNVLGIPPSQLLPNSYTLIIGFLLCAQLYEFDASVENFLGVFSPKITSGECFFYLSPRPGLTFIREKPSSHGAWKSKYFFLRKEGWQILLSWGSSLNPQPPLNLGEVKRRMKEAGLVDHEFSAKAILEDELLVVAGLHPASDTYDGPLDRFSRLRIMMNRVAMRKFIPEDVPAIPTSSGSRPVLPNDLPANLVPPAGTPSSSRSPRPIRPDDLMASATPLAGASSSARPCTSPSPVSQLNLSPFPQGTPIIEVGTPEENTTSQTPLDLPPASPLPPPPLSRPSPRH